MSQKILRRIGIVAGVIVALALILAGAWLWYERRSLPQTTGTVTVKGLQKPVEIYRDANGVAHIYAQTTEDLFFAQGYVHAQERFWQMEFQRRVGSGRLSEIIGKATLDTDIYLRTMGFRHLAEEDYKQLDPDNKKVLDSYAAGVNAYILNRQPEDLALEFAIFKLRGVSFAIEPWTGVDSLVWARMLVYDQSDKMRVEIRNADVLRAVGAKMEAEMDPPYRKGRPVIVPDEDEQATVQKAAVTSGSGMDTAYLNALDQVDLTLAGGFDAAALPHFTTGNEAASNSWVVSGKYTATGKPLLANDPHMSIQIPSLWYEVDLRCEKKSDECPYELQGFSLPGIPGILIGHNDRIAWGLTNAYFDAQDMYIEHINPDNPNQYEVNGKWVDMDIRREEIKVQGQDKPTVLLVRSTRHGPLVSDKLRPERGGYTDGDGGPVLLGLSLKWTALNPLRSAEAIIELSRSQNYDDFRKALQKFGVGTINFLYADVDGNIGYQLPGLIPIRAKGDGSLPVPGWTDDYEWTGYIPYDQLPRSFNPEKGYIAAPNNPQVTSSYPYMLGTEHDYGYRAQRITDMIQEMIKSGNKLTVEDMKKIQRDTKSLSALEVIPYLKDLTFDDAQVRAARDRLLNWDATMAPESPEAALYNYFWVELMNDTFNDQLPQNVWADGSGRNSETIYWLLQDNDNPWWDDVATAGVKETRDDILARAFIDGYKKGKNEQGGDFTRWQWGKMHTISFVESPLGQSGIGLIESIFNRGPFPVSGSEQVVNKIAWSTTSGFDASSAPALRQIVDLGNLGNTQLIFSTGQSGHPGDPHYDDFIQKWINVDYHPSLWNRADVEGGPNQHLTLQPGG